MKIVYGKSLKKKKSFVQVAQTLDIPFKSHLVDQMIAQRPSLCQIFQLKLRQLLPLIVLEQIAVRMRIAGRPWYDCSTIFPKATMAPSLLILTFNQWCSLAHSGVRIQICPVDSPQIGLKSLARHLDGLLESSSEEYFILLSDDEGDTFRLWASHTCPTRIDKRILKSYSMAETVSFKISATGRKRCQADELSMPLQLQSSHQIWAETYSIFITLSMYVFAFWWLEGFSLSIDQVLLPGLGATFFIAQPEMFFSLDLKLFFTSSSRPLKWAW